MHGLTGGSWKRSLRPPRQLPTLLCVKVAKNCEIIKAVQVEPYVVGTDKNGKHQGRNGDFTGGDTLTIAQARAEQIVLRAEINKDTKAGSTLHSNHTSIFMIVLAYFLLLVDAGALFMVFSFLLNIAWQAVEWSKLLIAIAFSFFGAGVQALLAHAIGNKLWVRRNAAANLDDEREQPPTNTVSVLMIFLALVSILIAVAILARVVAEAIEADAFWLGLPLALALAASALAAPWLIVQQVSEDGSFETRRLGHLGRLVQKGELTAQSARLAASKYLAEAKRVRDRATRRSEALKQKVTRCYVKPHRIILWARGIRYRWTAPITPDGDKYYSALPIMVPPDLRPVELAIDQMNERIESAEKSIKNEVHGA